VNISFLGTNGWYDTATGNTICILIKTESYDIILDAGNGFYKLDRYLTDTRHRPVHLFLSHFHIDHIAGLHTLNKFTFSRGLSIWGPTGTKGALGTIINTPFSMPLSNLPYRVTIHELPEERQSVPFSVETKPLLHSTLTLGYRITVDGKVVVYCPDTGYCENAVELSRSADLLIAECAYPSGESNDLWPHLNPETAARIAGEARARRLALIHFDARQYPTIEARLEAETVAKQTFPDTVATMDDMEIDL